MSKVLFEELLSVAEAQLDAARRVDARALMALNEERSALQGSLDGNFAVHLEAGERNDLRLIARRIQAADARTLRCGRDVLSVVSAVLPDAAPTTYSRRGRIRGA